MGNGFAVMFGGIFGATLRYGVGQLIPTADGFPVGTLLINLLGSLFLAWFFTVTSKHITIHPRLKLAIGTGFTGAFTTFSTFSVETLTLIEHDQIGMAITYILVSVLGGIAFAAIGVRFATRIVTSAEQVKGEA